MACNLSPSTTGNEDFVGAIGASFTLDMTAPASANLAILTMSYAGQSVTAAPFSFNIAAGINFFFIHFEALQPGAKLQVREVCGATQQVLETIHFDPGNPGTGYEIMGR